VVAVFTNVKSPVLVISSHHVLPLMRSCILQHINGTGNPVVGLVLQIKLLIPVPVSKIKPSLDLVLTNLDSTSI
jgi:hypothetical protein